MRSRIALLLIGLAALACNATAAEAKTFALIVGINKYAHVNKLEGADNDAQLLAATLHSLGTSDVRVLLDGQATRDAIYSNFRALVAEAKAGDWIVFSYAGHGTQEDERPPYRKPSHKDDVIVLTNFDTAAPLNRERIHDYEIKALLDEVPDSVKVLFVADACHSGTLTRKLDIRATGLTFRNVTYSPITDDALPPPLPTASDLLTRQKSNVVFASAALDTEVTPEITIEGAKHGALSWFVARGLAGDADQNHDGVVTLNEFREYVVTATSQAAESRQTPAVNFMAGRENEVLPFSPKAIPLPVVTRTKIWVDGGPSALLDGLPSIVAAADRKSADLLWDVQKKDVVDLQHGDLLAQRISDADGISGVADMWRALPRLYQLSSRNSLAMGLGRKASGRFDGAGALYRNGDAVTFRFGPLKDPALRYLTVFDLAGDGTVQPLFPGGKNFEQEAGPQPPNFQQQFDLNVQAPFGSDHLVAIATAEPPDELRAQLRALADQRAATQALDAIIHALAGKRYALGVIGLHSAP
jgi:hypothetical protein